MFSIQNNKNNMWLKLDDCLFQSHQQKTKSVIKKMSPIQYDSDIIQKNFSKLTFKVGNDYL